MPESSATTAQMPRRRLAGVEYRWIALGIVLLGAIMTILDATIVNIALQTLQTDFKVSSYSTVAWVVTGYALAQGAVIPVTGWATDRWGTKRLFLATIALFTLSSAACGLAGSLGQLVIFRVIQGLAGGMIMPIGMTIILNIVGPQQMGRVMGIFGVPMLLAPAAGPILGGWFVQDFTWRLIFYVNVPIGILAITLGWMLLQETPRRHALRLDVTGLLTSTGAILALMYGFTQSIALGWGSAQVLSLLADSAIFFAVFVAAQLHHRRFAGNLAALGAAASLVVGVIRGLQVGWWTVDALAMLGFAVLGAVVYVLTRERADIDPLLHLELFKDNTFKASMILSFIIVTTMFGAMLLLPLYLQDVDGFGALKTGLLLLPQAATAAIAMPLGGVLSDRLGPRPVVVTGLVLLGIGSVMLAQLSPTSSLWMLGGALALRGFAMGFAMMPSTAAALARIDRRFTSRASSITNSLQRAGSALGIAILMTFLAAQFVPAAQQATCNPSTTVVAIAQQAHLAQTGPELCATVGTQIASAVTNPNSNGSFTPPPGPLGQFVGGFATNTLSIAFDRTFFFIAIVSIIGVIPAFFLRRPDRGASMAPAEIAA